MMTISPQANGVTISSGTVLQTPPHFAALIDPRFKARLAELGGAPMPMRPAEFGKFLADETEKLGKVIRAANITPE